MLAKIRTRKLFQIQTFYAKRYIFPLRSKNSPSAPIFLFHQNLKFLIKQHFPKGKAVLQFFKLQVGFHATGKTVDVTVEEKNNHFSWLI